MMYKVKNGYEPQFLASEFMNFLCFFEKKMPIQDVLYEKEKLFQRFFERKAKDDWETKPHMDMLYSENDNDYVVKANYRLSNYDRSVINTYFMVKSKTAEIRKVIGEFLEKQPKREINDELLVEVVSRGIKQRNDSILEFEKAGRSDLVASVKDEIKILEEYLPEQLTEDEINQVIDDVFSIVKPEGARDMGRVMKEVSPKLKGRADMKKVSEIIRAKLQ